MPLKAFLPILLFGAAVLSLPLSQGATEEEIQGWIEGLGAGNLAERKESEQRLRDSGPQAMEALSKAAASKDPEIAVRAQEIRQRMLSGITEDTPKEVIDLVEVWNRPETGANQRLELLKQLRVREEVEIGARLLAHVPEEDLPVLQREVIAWLLPHSRALVKEGQIRQADLLFSCLGRLPTFARDWVVLRQLFPKGEGPGATRGELSDLEGWAGFFRDRLEGEMEAARSWAEAEGKPDWAAVAAFATGDYQPQLDLWLKRSRDPLIRSGFQLAAARLAGDAARETRLRESLAGMLEEANLDRVYQLSGLLTANGAVDPLLALEKTATRELVLSLLGQQGRYVEGLARAGLEGLGEEARREWLARELEVIEESSNLPEVHARVSFLTELAQTHSIHGDGESAAWLLRRLWMSLFASEHDGLTRMTLGNVAGLGAYQLWLDCAIAMRDREQDLGYRVLLGSGLGPARTLDEAVLQELAAEVAAWLEVEAGDPAVLSGMLALVSKEAAESFGVDAAGFLARLDAAARDLRGQPQIDRWLLLRVLYRAQEDGAKAMACLDRLREAGWEGADLAPLAVDCVRRGEWAAAIDLYQGFAASAQPGASFWLAHLAACWEKAGDSEEAARVRGPLEGELLGNVDQLTFLARLLEAHGLYEESQRYLTRAMAVSSSRELLRNARPRGGSSMLLDAAVASAKRAKDWEQAMLLSEARCLAALASSSRTGGALPELGFRFEADFLRAKWLWSQGRDREAMQAARQAHRMMRGSGFLSDDFFPTLKESADPTEASELLQETRAINERTLARFPESAQAHNNYAWLLSRVREDLPQAEEHVLRALELRPQEAAYVDTLAEVRLGLGESEEALQLSRQAIELSPEDQAVWVEYKRRLEEVALAEGAGS
ncbi:MAG: hypothetical protein AAF555_05440 [Verrucomicrobiota bacterium]